MSNFTIDFKINVISNLNKTMSDAIKKTKTSKKGVDGLNTSTKKVKRSLVSLLPSLNSINKKFGNIRFTVQNIQFLLTALSAGAFFKKIITEAVNVETAMLGLNVVSKALGENVANVQKAVKDLAKDGMIPLTDIVASFRNLLAKGLNLQESIKIINVLKDSASVARQGTLTLGEAIKSTTEGIKNDLSIKTDNAGITKNLSQIYGDFAKSINVGVKSLSEQQKVQALVIGFTKEGRIFQGAYNKSLNTFGALLNKIGARFRFFLVALGESITKSKSAKIAFERIGDALKRLETFANANAEEFGRIFVNAINLAIVAVGQFVSFLIRIRIQFKLLEKDTEAYSKLLKGSILLTLSADKGKGFLLFLEGIREKMLGAKKETDSETKALIKLLGVIEKINKANIKLFGTGGERDIDKTKVTLKGGAEEFEPIKIETFTDKLNKVIDKFTIAFGKNAKTISNVFDTLAGGDPKKSVLGLTKTALTTAFGPEGQAVASAIQFLAQDPEQFRIFVRAFIDAIPEIINNIALNIPILIEEFIKGFPKLQEELLKLQIRLAEKYTASILRGANKFVEEIVKGAGRFVEEIVKGIGDSLGGGVGGGVGGILKDIGLGVSTGGISSVAKSIGFANGGVIGSGSTSGDNTLIRANKKERVLTAEQNEGFEKLVEMVTGGEQPQIIQVDTKINEKVLIETIINLQRTRKI